jgi:hypothetical protein
LKIIKNDLLLFISKHTKKASHKPKKGSHYYKLTPLDFLAGPMGLEPTPSGVTGRRYNQLNYDPKKSF